MTIKLADNTASTAQGTTGAGTYTTVAVEAEQSAAMADVDWGDFTSVFFAAGVVINLVMITAYFIWAYKQWNKQAASDE